MLFSRPTISDDRGVRVGVVTFSRDLAREDPELGSTLARVFESANGLTEKVSGTHVLMMLTGLVFMAAAIVLCNLAPGLPAYAGILACFVGAVVPGMLLSRRLQARYSNRIAESALRIGRCPTCGYRLRGTPPDATGLVACPECGSCWRQDRVGSASVAPTDVRPVPDTPGDSVPMGWFAHAWWSRLPTIVDDRDRSMSMTDPALPRLADPERRWTARLLLRARLRAAKAGWMTVCVLGMIFAAGLASVLVFGTGAPGWAKLQLLMPALWLVSGIRVGSRVLRGRSRLLARRTRAILMELRVCPACSADLRDVPAEADACTVCPACAAAWKLAPEPRPHASIRNTTIV